MGIGTLCAGVLQDSSENHKPYFSFKKNWHAFTHTHPSIQFLLALSVGPMDSIDPGLRLLPGLDHF